MIMKGVLADPFGRKSMDMDMALSGTLAHSCFRSRSMYLPEEDLYQSVGLVP
jgi:hypothetical protein